MRIHEFETRSLSETPWKNGRGTTREIACWPVGSDLNSFVWRVSIATITASTPFSTFAGVDRTILLLSGRGVHLRSGDGAIDHRLDRPEQPFSFAGEASIDCESLGPQSRDFNVMTRRGAYRSETQLWRAGTGIEAAPFGLLLALRGAWRIDAGEVRHLLAPAAGLWWEQGADVNLTLSPDAAHDASDRAMIVVRWLDALSSPA